MTAPFPEKKYSIIYADPPWFYNPRNYKATKFGGGVHGHYKPMTNQEILDLPVQQLANDNCALFLWVTGPRFDFGIEVLKHWGFRYINVSFDWVKTNKINGFPFKGIGHYTKSNPEWCLLGMKGSLEVKSNSVYNVIEDFEPEQIISPRQEHSKKPDIVRKRIVDLFGDLPRIELFARQHVPGWECWGNEVQSNLNIYKGAKSSFGPGPNEAPVKYSFL